MTRKNAAALAGSALLLAGLLGAAAMPLAGDVDYSAIPPEPASVAKRLEPARGRLVAAIDAAESAVGGIAQSARVDLDADPAVVEVVAYDPARAWRLTVDLTSGAVRSKTEIPRFPGEPVSGDWQESESGLKWFDLVEGDGPSPSGLTSQVRVHYSGWLTTGEKFDSSVDRGEPIVFPLGRVIPGWGEGVGSMKVGGKRKLVIPYWLAYGEAGNARIPAKATLIFDVELIEIVNE